MGLGNKCVFDFFFHAVKSKAMKFNSSIGKKKKHGTMWRLLCIKSIANINLTTFHKKAVNWNVLVHCWASLSKTNSQKFHIFHKYMVFLQYVFSDTILLHVHHISLMPFFFIIFFYSVDDQSFPSIKNALSNNHAKGSNSQVISCQSQGSKYSTIHIWTSHKNNGLQFGLVRTGGC